MLNSTQLRSALLDLAEFQQVLLSDLADALQVLAAAGPGGELSSSASHWSVGLVRHAPVLAATEAAGG